MNSPANFGLEDSSFVKRIQGKVELETHNVTSGGQGSEYHGIFSGKEDTSDIFNVFSIHVLLEEVDHQAPSRRGQCT